MDETRVAQSLMIVMFINLNCINLTFINIMYINIVFINLIVENSDFC